MQADRVGRAAAGDQPLAVDPGLGEFAAKLEHEPFEALVGDQEVRAEPDGCHRQLPLVRPRQRFLELSERARPRERPGRTLRCRAS